MLSLMSPDRKAQSCKNAACSLCRLTVPLGHVPVRSPLRLAAFSIVRPLLAPVVYQMATRTSTVPR